MCPRQLACPSMSIRTDVQQTPHRCPDQNAGALDLRGLQGCINVTFFMKEENIKRGYKQFQRTRSDLTSGKPCNRHQTRNPLQTASYVMNLSTFIRISVYVSRLIHLRDVHKTHFNLSRSCLIGVQMKSHSRPESIAKLTRKCLVSVHIKILKPLNYGACRPM
jgi:hypothetical protein